MATRSRSRTSFSVALLVVAACSGDYRTANDAGSDASGGDDGSADACVSQVTHSNGLGQTWNDCVPRGTYDQTQAYAACAAFTRDSGECVAISCGDGGAFSALTVCSEGSPVACACWNYSGANVGRVSNSGSSGPANCFCIGLTNTQHAWN